MLEEALQDYEGTVVLVSHDRYFISRVANKIVEVRDGELVAYAGDYHYYLDKIQAEQEAEKRRLIAEQTAKKQAEKRAKQAEKKAGKTKKAIAP